MVAVSLKKLVRVVYVVKLVDTELFIIFLYYPFNVNRISSNSSSLISSTSNLCCLSFFSFVSVWVDLYFLIILICLFMLLCITVYVIFYLFQIPVIVKFLLLSAGYFQVAINILEVYSVNVRMTQEQRQEERSRV